MTSGNSERTTKVVVRFTQQQMELLEKLRREKTLGTTLAEVVVNVFRDFVRQESPKGGA